MFKYYNQFSTLAIITISSIALGGWWGSHALVSSWMPGIANMTFNTALCFLFMAVGCYAISKNATSMAVFPMTIGIVVGIFSFLSLLQDVFGFEFSIDNMLFDSHHYQLLSPYPGRMSNTTAFGFLIASLTLIALTIRGQASYVKYMIHSGILLVTLISLLGLGMNIIMGEPPQNFAHIASISTMTSLSFLMLAISFFFVFKQYYITDEYLIFYSGIELMFSLSFPQKISLISIIFATPMFILMWNTLDSLQQDVYQAEQKIIGVQYVHNMAELLDSIPKHRGMMHAQVANPSLFTAELKKSTAMIDRLFSMKNRTLASQTPAMMADWTNILQRWRRINRETQDPIQTWRLHSEMIILLQQYLQHIGKVTALTYDNDPVIHNLVSIQLDVLPALFEQIAQLRGQGSGFIAKRKLHRDQQLLLSSMISQTTLRLDECNQLIQSAWLDQEKINRNQDIVQLIQLNRKFTQLSQVFLSSANTQLIQSRTFSITSKYFFTQATEALNAGYTFNHASLEYVEEALKKRINTNLNRQFRIKLSILLVAIVLLYLFVSFYLSIMSTIRLFGRAVERLRQGENSELLLLPARDEMVHAFNSLSNELIQMSSQMTAVVDHAVDAIITIDEHGTIESFNPAATKMFAYQQDEILGKNITELMPEEYQARHHSGLNAFLYGAKGVVDKATIEVFGLKKDSSQFPISLSVSSMMRNNKLLFIGLIRDMSQHNQMEEELRQAQKIQAIGVLVGGVAHNFNNILAGIVGQAYLAKSACGQKKSPVGHLEAIEHISMQAGDMVKQLLTFSRQDFFRKKEMTSLQVLINEAFNTGKLGIPEDIQLKLDLGEDDEITVCCDINQIQQILINLMNNARDAVEHSPRKKITVALYTCQPKEDFFQRHQALKEGRFACFSVSDTGVGISKKTLPHIFEPFFTSKDVGKGTGLGLSSAMGSIASHDGVIEVESIPQKRTTFSVYLPLSESPLAPLTEEDDRIVPSLKGETLLLVDDDPVVLDSTHAVLKSLGYQVMIAHDGEQGLQCFRSHRDAIHAIVTDVVMPVLGGVDMYRQIRPLAPSIPILFMTGYDQGGVSLHAHETEYVTIVSKPISIAELSQKIQAMLYANLP